MTISVETNLRQQDTFHITLGNYLLFLQYLMEATWNQIVFPIEQQAAGMENNVFIFTTAKPQAKTG